MRVFGEGERVCRSRSSASLNENTVYMHSDRKNGMLSSILGYNSVGADGGETLRDR